LTLRQLIAEKQKLSTADWFVFASIYKWICFYISFTRVEFT